MRCQIKKYKKTIVSFFKENKFLMKPILTIYIIYMVGILAIILAGVHFADDVARTNYGYAGWSGFSRYLSTILSHGLHADNYLTNIYPLPQILAVGILAIASALFICVILGKEILKAKWTKWVWIVIAVVPLVLSPYMLECLSYQYDAPYMALSILFSILPLVLMERSRWAYGVTIMVSVLVICMTYQAAIGIMPMMVIFIAMREWNKKSGMKNKEILKLVFFTAAIFLLTLVIFQKFLMRPRDAYASNELPGITEFFPAFFAHLKQYFELILGDFRLLWKVLICLIMISFVGLFVVRSEKKKILALVIAIVGVFVMFLMTLAFYAALDKPLYAPRAMYAIGSFLALMAVYIVGGGKGDYLIIKIPVFILSWCFVVFALTFGNALREQNDYRNNRVQMIMTDLNSLEVMQIEGVKRIQVNGEIGLAPAIKHMPINDYRILYRLMMPSFSKYVPWMVYRILYQPDFDNVYYDQEVDLGEEKLPLLKETVLYSIYGDEEATLIDLKNDENYNLVF